MGLPSDARLHSNYRSWAIAAGACVLRPRQSPAPSPRHIGRRFDWPCLQTATAGHSNARQTSTHAATSQVKSAVRQDTNAGGASFRQSRQTERTTSRYAETRPPHPAMPKSKYAASDVVSINRMQTVYACSLQGSTPAVTTRSLASKVSALYTLTWPSRSRYPTGKWYKRSHHSQEGGTLFACLYKSTLEASMQDRHVVPPATKPSHRLSYTVQSSPCSPIERPLMLEYSISKSHSLGRIVQMTYSSSATYSKPQYVCLHANVVNHNCTTIDIRTPFCVTTTRVSIPCTARSPKVGRWHPIGLLRPRCSRQHHF